MKSRYSVVGARDGQGFCFAQESLASEQRRSRDCSRGQGCRGFGLRV